jgi:hypothetical protein
MFEIQSALLVYVLGIVIGLTVMRDPWPARLVTALVWPLGPIAFVIVVAIMLVTAAILWPVLILGSAAVLGAVIYMTAC